MRYLARLEVRIPPDTVDLMRLMAAERDEPVSSVARRLLVAAVRRQAGIDQRRRVRDGAAHRAAQAGPRALQQHTALDGSSDE